MTCIKHKWHFCQFMIISTKSSTYINVISNIFYWTNLRTTYRADSHQPFYNFQYIVHFVILLNFAASKYVILHIIRFFICDTDLTNFRSNGTHAIHRYIVYTGIVNVGKNLASGARYWSIFPGYTIVYAISNSYWAWKLFRRENVRRIARKINSSEDIRDRISAVSTWTTSNGYSMKYASREAWPFSKSPFTRGDLDKHVRVIYTQLRDDSYEHAIRKTMHYAVALAWLLAMPHHKYTLTMLARSSLCDNDIEGKAFMHGR